MKSMQQGGNAAPQHEDNDSGSTAYPLSSPHDLDALIDRIGNSKVVMLGEASHGNHEYYTWRAAITRRLVTEKGFSFIAVEGDWPDCYNINRYIKHYPGSPSTAREVLDKFNRWPSWMWANWEIAALMEWLRDHNSKKQPGQRTGFYGLDVYSLWESIEAVVSYLEKEDPDAAVAARQAMRCFQPYAEDPQGYAHANFRFPGKCKDAVLKMLAEIVDRSPIYDSDPEAALSTEQNAHVVVNAEKYYRSMVSFSSESWNIRDTHMAETLQRLLDFHGSSAKAIVWEHNTHIGDARATDMADDEMVNIGQLARERYGESEVALVGFASYKGSVIAGRAWGAPMQEMEMPPAQPGSVEYMLHNESSSNRMIIFENSSSNDRFMQELTHRAIGVVYHPEREKLGNYVPSIMAKRYDALIYLDETKALHPLHHEKGGNKIPDTYPFGM